MQSARIHPVARRLAQFCRRFCARRLSSPTLTQVSVRDGDLRWLTPLNADIGMIEAEALLLIAPPGWNFPDRNPDRNGTPPDRLALHQAFYEEYPEIQAIVIAKPPFASAYLLRQTELSDELPSLTVPGCPKPVYRIEAPFTPPSAALMEAMEATGDGEFSRLFLLGEDVISVGDSLETAARHLELLESAAHQAFLLNSLSASQP